MNANTKPAVVEMTKEKDCKGSVKFSTKAEQPNALVAVDNLYVARSMDGINGAQRIRVTVEIIG